MPEIRKWVELRLSSCAPPLARPLFVIAPSQASVLILTSELRYVTAQAFSASRVPYATICRIEKRPHSDAAGFGLTRSVARLRFGGIAQRRLPRFGMIC